MKSVNIKKSVIFCAFSINANNIFCANGLCGIWSGNKIIEAEKGDKDKFIDNIINNKDLKIKDSSESLIIDNGNSFKEELLNCFKDCKEDKEGILTEFEYNKKFHYFFSTKNLIVTDFLEKPTSDEVKVFGELSSRNFKRINVEVKGGKLIVKNDNPSTPKHKIPNPNGKGKKLNIDNQGQQNPKNKTGFSQGNSNGKETNRIPSKEYGEDDDKEMKANSENKGTEPSTETNKGTKPTGTEKKKTGKTGTETNKGTKTEKKKTDKKGKNKK